MMWKLWSYPTPFSFQGFIVVHWACCGKCPEIGRSYPHFSIMTDMSFGIAEYRHTKLNSMVLLHLVHKCISLPYTALSSVSIHWVGAVIRIDLKNLKTTSLSKSSTSLKLRLICFIKFFWWGISYLLEGKTVMEDFLKKSFLCKGMMGLSVFPVSYGYFCSSTAICIPDAPYPWP